MTRARHFIGVAGLCLLFAGCASQGAVPNAAVASAEKRMATAGLTLDTPISDICNDPGGRAVLDRDLPSLRENPNYVWFQGWSLRQLAGMSSGRITSDDLERVRLDLAALSPAPAAASQAH
jgi:hypothetical protein